MSVPGPREAIVVVFAILAGALACRSTSSSVASSSGDATSAEARPAEDETSMEGASDRSEARERWKQKAIDEAAEQERRERAARRRDREIAERWRDEAPQRLRQPSTPSPPPEEEPGPGAP